MGSSIRNFLANFQYFSLALVFLLLTACGDPEDPVVESTGEAPIVENFGVAYLKRPSAALNINANQATSFPTGLDANDPTQGVTPGNVYFKDLSSGQSVEINITQGLTDPTIGDITNIQNGDISAGDVSDLAVSYDGRYLLFSMHEGMELGLDDREQTNTWNIWIYDVESGGPPVRVITDDLEAGLGNDIDPHFLPDGRIVFSSDRQTRNSSTLTELFGYGPEVRQLNESGGINFRNTSYGLHVMNPDGTNIAQITLNHSNDLNPTVLKNGKILFSRWDNVGGRSELNLYTINPDGTDLNIYYGAHSHGVNGVAGSAGNNSEQYIDFKQMPDGTLIGTLARFANTRGRSKLITIDHENFVEYNTKRFTSPSLASVGHYTAIATPFLQGNSLASLEGSYITPFPIYEPGQTNRLLVSWDPCRVRLINSVVNEPCDSGNTPDDSGYELADPLNSILLYELGSDASGWVAPPEEGIAIVDPVALINIPVIDRPVMLPNSTLDQNLLLRGVGAISIKSVYDTQGNIAMEDTPLRPFNRTNILTTAEEALFPPRVTVQMDAVTGNVVSDPADPSVVPVDRLVADIPSIRLSTVTNTADQRVARFVRISKPVPRVFEADRDQNAQRLNGDDFGRTGNNEMREILGYTVVEPDGSVYVEVPANIPFTIDVLDASGRSFMAHTNWMQVAPGEVKVCNGCHSPNDGQGPVNVGATTVGPFPNTVNTMIAEVGETMAETRARLDCLGTCTYPKLKRDLVYDDPWTDMSLAGRAPDAGFTIGYDMLTVSPVEGTGTCDAALWGWNGEWCRIAIDFPTDVQQIFEDHCVGCHNDDNPAVAPPGNLVLEQIIDAANSPRLQALRDARTDPDRIASYEFLFIQRPRMEPDPVTGGRRFIVTRNAAGEAINDVDGDGIPEVIAETDIANLDFINQRPSLVRAGVANARHSPLLYVLTGDPLATGTEIATPAMDHTTLLTDDEKRLLIEWIDNGTQYFNDLDAALSN